MSGVTSLTILRTWIQHQLLFYAPTMQPNAIFFSKRCLLLVGKAVYTGAKAEYSITHIAAFITDVEAWKDTAYSDRTNSNAKCTIGH